MLVVRNATRGSTICFDVGVKCGFAVDSLTIEGLSLRDQNKVGLYNEGQCLTVRKLTSRSSALRSLKTTP